MKIPSAFRLLRALESPIGRSSSPAKLLPESYRRLRCLVVRRSLVSFLVVFFPFRNYITLVYVFMHACMHVDIDAYGNIHSRTIHIRPRFVGSQILLVFSLAVGRTIIGIFGYRCVVLNYVS